MTRGLERPRLRLGLASFRLRILFRGVFLLLALATIAFAVVLLQDEKDRSYRSYEQSLRRTQADLLARLKQPAGLFALLNAGDSSEASEATPLRPKVLPYPSLDFDDPNRAQQAVDAAGCAVRYPDGGTLCAGVGSSAVAGGFLYLVGSFRSGELAGREGGELDIEASHRARVRVEMRGEVRSWIAPFERLSMRGEPLVRGRLSAFETTGDPTLASARPVRDFRGWLWQSATCSAGGEPPDCARSVFYAMRLPLDALREGTRTAWPPPDLRQSRIHVQMLAPGDGPPLFDSNAPGAEGAAPLEQFARSLLPGETLTVRAMDSAQPSVVLKGATATEPSSPLIVRLIDRLPVATRPPPMQARETIATPLGSYDVRLASDARGIDRNLGAIATRLSWYVAAMLGAIALAWLVIEVGLIRRIAVLAKRAAAVSHDVQHDARGGERIGRLDVSDLRGNDELGLLAGGLADLLQRVKDDVQREQRRAGQERDMLQAVGHEILSPLQSLMVLHPHADDPAHRYVQRMQQAVRVLYGQASPSEALAAARIDVAPLDLDAFLRHVAQNAGFAGIADVRYAGADRSVMVRADEFALEDVVTHVLRNAERHRTPGSAIEIALSLHEGRAVAGIRNAGPPIDNALLDRIFDYGVGGSEAGEAGEAGELRDGPSGERRGQGLFVARTYMVKMGGTIVARNVSGGVCFELALPRA
ncbi:sensor histidine kinase [Ramlibacter sp.]|uniref:sensor histidine kinase n=1 Tax=Ramlibacter sp. TaxID=1917967 RepID=UPI003D147C7C